MTLTKHIEINFEYIENLYFLECGGLGEKEKNVRMFVTWQRGWDLQKLSCTYILLPFFFVLFLFQLLEMRL